jgi:hypothetical protein
MRDYETIKNELEYLRSSAEASPQNATFESIMAEMLLDIRKILLEMSEESGEEIWGDDLLSLLEDDSL